MKLGQVILHHKHKRPEYLHKLSILAQILSSSNLLLMVENQFVMFQN